jgi:hypothetical protein
LLLGLVGGERLEGFALLDARDVDDALEGFDESDFVHFDLDVLFEGVQRDDTAWLPEDEVEQGLELACVD